MINGSLKKHGEKNKAQIKMKAQPTRQLRQFQEEHLYWNEQRERQPNNMGVKIYVYMKTQEKCLWQHEQFNHNSVINTNFNLDV